jgi:nucleotide-binding universal stress UspA family protein
METLLTIVREPGKAKGFIDYVARLSQDLQVHIRLLYVQEAYEYTLGLPPAPDIYTIESVKDKEVDAEKELSKLVQEATSRLTGEISIDYTSVTDSTLDVIDDHISSGKASLVVLEGHESRNYLSNAPSNNDIIDEVHCPLLIIPWNAIFRPYTNIVYATEYREKDIQALKDLIRITGKVKPSITALHITDHPDYEEKIKQTGFNEMLKQETRYKDIIVDYSVKRTDAELAQQIKDFADNTGADLLVVRKENRNFLERIFNPDPTRRILKEAILPVMIFK